ncbi:MAG: hypothetical protein LBC94_04180 [Desulfovibrio sp.]|jgi:hypothetical protein|nr:hypothetical protein [Desulfovibrio sp.]
MDNTAYFLRLTLAVGALSLALASCATIETKAPPQPAGPVENFIISAAPGQSATLDDPAFGDDVRVAADTPFISANGEECRRATVTAGAREAEVVVVCRPAGGNWIMAPRVWGDDGN